MITYRQLRDSLNKLSEEQLDCHLAIEMQLSDEVLSGSEDDIRFDVADVEHSMLHEGHPVIVCQF